MDEIRVEFVHIDRLFHARRGAEAGGAVVDAGKTEGPRPC